MALELECSDLKSRQASHGFVNDEAYAEAVVERIFCDTKYDLLSVFPFSMGSLTNDYAEVIDTIGTKSLAFQVIFFFFFVFDNAYTRLLK